MNLLKIQNCTKFFICILIFPFVLNSQISKSDELKIDSIFMPWAQDNSPGAAVGIIWNGQLHYSKGFGMANLENDVPITPSSVFYMASVSKHFVTMCILLLEEQGKLDLDAEIQTYLPDFPRYDSPITIRHFVHHTSGVRDFLTLWALKGNDPLNHSDEREIYELIKRQKELNFTPGERYLYSNSCYFMLSMIVEKVSGKNIKEFAEEQMFGPLGMKNTHFHNDHLHIIKNRVTSYAPAIGRYLNLTMRFDLVGSGGLYSSIEDLYLWDQNFYKNKLGEKSPRLIERMHEEGLLNNGKSTNYGFGLVNEKYKGLKTVSHGGALGGYRTHFVRIPNLKFSIFILSNVSNFQPGEKANKIIDILLSDQFKTSIPAVAKQSQKKNKTISLPEDKLQNFTGLYWNTIENYSRKIYLKDGKLIYHRSFNSESPLIPVDKNSFVMGEVNAVVKIEFKSDLEGKKSMFVTVDDGQRLKFEGYQEISYNEDQLKQFTGTYYSEELDEKITIELDGPLVIKRNGMNISQLQPKKEDTFSAGPNMIIDFQKNSNNSIIEFRLHAGRVQNLKFEKENSLH